ncbi:MAG TPA: HAD family hydrolase [Candidatus Limnocylindrales bacterium]|nr:HAD family hydrolase [Candidatus Limnocylindrales bacterium]
MGQRLRGVGAITLDFGNTLVPVSRAGLRAVTERTAATVADALGLADPAVFRTAWAEERDRQFREEVPELREMDLHQRAIRILARLRGMAPPAPDVRWDDAAAGRLADPAEVDAIVEAYSRTFVEAMPPAPAASEVLATLAGRGFRVAILSNWPLAATIDRYAVAAGWDRHLAGIFVSQRIGVIKPHPAIFAFAADALGTAAGAILHVGDDWAADVVGARGAGFRVAYLRDHQDDTPLPTSDRSTDVTPDLELDRLADLPSRVADPTA